QLGEKNRELNAAMDELKENEARLLQAEKLSSLGRMSAGIVHEVNNPLNYAKTAIHALKLYGEDIPEDERADFSDMLGDAEEGVNRVIAIVSDLRSFTKGETTMRNEVLFADVIEMARRLVSRDLQSVDFRVEIPEDLMVMANENQLCQVFVNLIQNAAQSLAGTKARGEDPCISITAQATAGGEALVILRDNGCGIAPEDLENIFDPFFTKREVGEGMGLGLSICHRIIESHGGRIEVESVVNRFTEFCITLPQAHEDDEFPDDEPDPRTITELSA
ncbi:MAG: GHKL domain-containing protein, partial [Akkermansiaceae bacterium]|nr:GHKL domain-containing protein [Akkermansiaceae bacterium]